MHTVYYAVSDGRSVHRWINLEGGRAAGNRTRSTSTPWMRTTGILRPGRKETICVGPPGIEPGLYAPEAYVLPVYYGPTQNTSFPAQQENNSPASLVRSIGFEPMTFRV